MAHEPGWARNVCDGSSEHCVGITFVEEDDDKAKSIWHTRKYITKDGEAIDYFFCQSCADEYDKIVGDHDRTIHKFIKTRGV